MLWIRICVLFLCLFGEGVVVVDVDVCVLCGDGVIVLSGCVTYVSLLVLPLFVLMLLLWIDVAYTDVVVVDVFMMCVVVVGSAGIVIYAMCVHVVVVYVVLLTDCTGCF